MNQKSINQLDYLLDSGISLSMLATDSTHTELGMLSNKPICKKTSYSLKLTDQRWITLRNKILSRDNYKCRNCGSKQNLQVHHLKYTGEPWEAPENDLLTLCEGCHKKAHSKQIYKFFLTCTRFIVFHKALTYAAREAKEATTTLNVLMANVERENLVRMRPDMIAEQLNLSLATVERHLAKLRKLSLIVPDAIERDRKIGITNWRIYPYLSWQGGTNALDAYMAALPSNHVWRTIGS